MLLPEIVSRDHRTAGAERRHEVDHEDRDVVHEGDAGDRRLAAAGDHDRVQHADEDREKLLHDERPDQLSEIRVTVKILFWFCLFHQGPSFRLSMFFQFTNYKNTTLPDKNNARNGQKKPFRECVFLHSFTLHSFALAALHYTALLCPASQSRISARNFSPYFAELTAPTP